MIPIRTVDDRPFLDAGNARDVWNRFSVFCKEILSINDEIIIVVSHGVVLPIMWAVWMKWDIAMLDKAEFYGAAGGVSFLQQTKEGMRVIMRLNDMSYSGEDYHLV